MADHRGTMRRTLLQLAAASATAVLLLTVLRRDDVRPEPFELELFEAVPVDGSVLLRVAGSPLAEPRLVLDGPMGDVVLEPLPGEDRRGRAVGFAAGADDVAAATGVSLRTARGTCALPAPTSRPRGQALQVARAAV